MKYILLLAFSLFSFISYSQDNTTSNYSIDVELKECIKLSEGIDAEIVKCELNAAEAWDGELNKYYKQLMGVLNPEQQKALKESQRQWIIYKDMEGSFLSQFYGKQKGSMWRVVSANRVKEIIKTRALELKEYYEIQQSF
ncbi:DUF1311 domain-containing protein [Flavobacterium alkalisoli]|uniref:DUF1311 domain-containing protein n=1 Tax=Flavobacterium alkalisoli TaxID=2602769 RepID=A0A5B9FTP7_9FLAO|nr:lysozyme inhibitor LprI family protein [Flavobacterium alkalisoli]QEE48147.1 DUF1311 domain-containing protein [Flavobacterium alkalisoli]